MELIVIYFLHEILAWKKGDRSQHEKPSHVLLIDLSFDSSSDMLRRIVISMRPIEDPG